MCPARGSFAPALRFGDYVADGLLGPGGVTETYLAHRDGKHDKGTGLYAVKLLRRDRVAEERWPMVKKRFVDVGRQLRDFHRPGFCKVIDVTDDTEATFIVSEHVPGRDLGRGRSSAADESGSLDARTASLIGSEIARLLQVGHGAKPIFCHLGLSPPNVLVTEAGEVVLVDAGISAALRTITEQPVDRWAFVAPEMQGVDAMAGLSSARGGIAADLYALGAILDFLLTRGPWHGPGQALKRDDLPGKLVAALRTLLSSDPDDRPERAALLVDWLADGVSSIRERQRLISEALRRVELGAMPEEVDGSEKEGGTGLSELTAPPTVVHAGSSERGGVAVTQTRRSRLRLGRYLAVAAVSCLCGAAGFVAMGRWGQQGIRQEGDADRDHAQPARAKPQAGGSVSVEVAVKAPRRAPVAKDDESSDVEPILARVAGHLVVETVPPGATVWVDGVMRGKTFVDLVIGDGGHRVVLIVPGHHMFRDVVDTSKGAIIRRTLVPVAPPIQGNAFVDVECHTQGSYPVYLDEEETGFLCPARMVPVTAGKHTVGIFVPSERRILSIETTVAMGPKPTVVVFRE